MSNLIIGQNFSEHPFKAGVRRIIEQHFAPEISNRFYFVLEVEKYHKGNKGISSQLKDQKYIMEVYYTHKSGLIEYICDVFSDWPVKGIEAHILRHVTDKVVTGLIGKDWIDNGKGRISEAIISRQFETKGGGDI